MIDIVEYLASKNLNPRPAGEGNVRCLCPFHNEEEGKPGRLYVQTEDGDRFGLMFCFVCAVKGSINKLRKFYGDSPLEFTSTEFTNPIIEVATQYYQDKLYENFEAYLNLEDRGLEDSTIAQARLGYADGSLGSHLISLEYTPEDIKASGLVRLDGSDYFKNEIVFPCLQYGRPVQIRGKKTGGMKAVPTVLYNTDSILGEDTIFVCEGEFDTLTMQQMGFNTIGVPGVHVWKDEWTEQISDAKRVYIIFDQDTAGIAGAEKTASKIGPRSRIVQLPVKKTDVNDWYVKYGKRREDFEWLLSKAKGGLLVTAIQSYEKWTEIEGNPDLAGLRFNIGPLDKALTHGLIPGQVATLISRTNTGKGHPLHTEIYTPDGVKLWGDLRVGDAIYGSNGKATFVTNIFDRGVLPTYRVTFTDKTFVDCDGDHIWTVHKDSWSENNYYKNRTTLEILHDGYIGYKSDGKKYYRYTIPMTKPIDFPERDLPIEPYTLGTLLSNGYLSGSGTEFRTPDADVAGRVASESKVTPRELNEKYCPNYGVVGVRHLTRELGIDIASGGKFIPEIYLQASIQQRTALLQGLFDGDGGHTGHAGRSVCYYTTSPRLAKDVASLVQTLGGTGSISSIDRLDRSGEVYKDITVSCMFDDEINPFSSNRKNIEQEYTNKHIPRRAIASIEQIENSEIRCISVNAPDSLYLIGRECIVTHNTIWAINVMHRMRMADEEFKVLYVSLEQTRNEWFERAHRIHNFYRPGASVMDTVNYWKNNILLIDKNRVSSLQLRDSVEQYAYESGRPPDLIIVDYLGYYARSFSGNAKEQTTEAIMGLKELGKELETRFLAPHQANRTGEIGKKLAMDMAKDAATVEETSDLMLTLYKPEMVLGSDNKDDVGKVYQEIIKSRDGGVGTEFFYHFAPLTLAMVPSDDEMYDLAVKERAYAMAGDTWQQATQRRIDKDMSI